MKCSNCKAPLRRRAKFCPKCGARVKHTARNILLIVLAVVLLLGGAGVAGCNLGVFQTASSNNDKNFVLLSGTFTDRLIVDQESALAAIGDVADVMGIDDAKAELADCKENMVTGNTYYRYQQMYQGIPVYGRSVIIAANTEGNGLSLSGNYAPVLKLNMEATASQESVHEAVQKYFCRQLGTTEVQDIFIEEISDDAVCIYNMNGYNSLAYQLYVEVPQLGCYEAIVDAQEPEVIYANSLIQYNYEYDEGGQTETISANGQRIMQSIDVYRNSDCYIMADANRNIEVYKMQGEFWWGYSRNTNELDAVSWASAQELQQYANEVDALANVQTSYDYFLSNFAHCSTDGKGEAIIVILTDCGYDKNTTIWKSKGTYNNASSASGIVDNTKVTRIDIGLMMDKTADTLAANLDTVAHEYTHAVNHFIAGLVEGSETSALNEGIADIFGELVEAWHTGVCDWVELDRNIASPSGSNLINYATFNENVECHDASTIISHAAYLMHTGIGGNPAFESLSTNDLAHLFYRTLYTLPSDCTFSQFRSLVQNMADIMCQQGALTEKQRLCVSNAFFQVGITPAEEVYYTVSDELSLLVYDVNGDQYSDYDVTVSPITQFSGYDAATSGRSGFTLPFQRESETYAANELLTLDMGNSYEITVTDRDGDHNSVTYYLSVRPSGKSELPIYTDFGEAANDAFPSYLEAARLTTAPGSWTEDLTMTANMVLTSGSSTTKVTATVGATTDIDGCVENNPSGLRMSGSANMAVAGQRYAWDMTYANGMAHYDYTEPTVTSADIKIDPSYFNFNSITQDMVSESGSLGNTIQFTVRGDAMTKVGLSAVDLMEGIENLQYGDVYVTAEINADTGKIGALSMAFHATMTYQGYDAEVDYVIEYLFRERYVIGICQLVQHNLLDAAVQGFKDALTDTLGDVVLFDHKIASGDTALCSEITDGFVEEKVDLIMAASTLSLRAAAASTKDIPILGTAVTDYAMALGIDHWTGITGRNISGTSDYNLLQESSAYYELGYVTGVMAYNVLINNAEIESMPIQYLSTTNASAASGSEEEVNYTVYLEDQQFSEWDRYTGNEGDSFIEKVGTRNSATDINGNKYTHGIECWVARWNYKNETSWVWKEWGINKSYRTIQGEITEYAGREQTP